MFLQKIIRVVKGNVYHAHMHAFGWIFLCHLEDCDPINFIDKNVLTLYCLITWNENLH